VIYDEASKELGSRDLAELIFKRTVILGMVGLFSSGIGCAVALPFRFSEMPPLNPTILSIPILFVLIEAVLFAWWRRPPAGRVEHFSRVVEERRRAGRPLVAVTKTYIAFLGVGATVFAFLITLVIPM